MTKLFLHEQCRIIMLISYKVDVNYIHAHAV